MTPERYARLTAVLNQRQPDLTVLLDNVHKPHNAAAIVRTADAVGILEVHAVWPTPRLRPNPGRSAGSQRWVRVRTHPNLPDAMAHVKATGHQLVAAHPAPEALDYRELDYTRPTALLLGAELFGVSPAGLEAADALVTIPMHGMVGSLNVSVAAALILFEAERQRRRAGLYDGCRLDPETYRRLLFEWGYPGIADVCRRRGEPYPELDDEGGLVAPDPQWLS